MAELYIIQPSWQVGKIMDIWKRSMYVDIDVCYFDILMSNFYTEY